MTKLSKTLQQNLWICCLLLEVQWDFLLDFQSLVQWKLYTLLLRLSINLLFNHQKMNKKLNLIISFPDYHELSFEMICDMTM